MHSPFKHALKSGVLLALGIACLWMPHTEFYMLRGENSWVFVMVSVVGTCVGVLLARALWQWAEDWATQKAAQDFPEENLQEETEDTPAPPWVRWGLLVAMLISAAWLLWGIERNPATQHTNDLQTIVSTLGCLVLGVVAGRWILMQARAAQEKTPTHNKPLVLPPWTKWLTGSLIAAAGLFAALGGHTSDNNPNEGGFLYGGIAFAVAICAALWTARRFEEQEKVIKEKERQKNLL
jgi:hypothetical protein